MRGVLQIELSLLVAIFVSIAGCEKGPEPVPALPPAPAPLVSAPAPGASTAAAAPSASSTPPAPRQSEYPICGGQHVPQAASVPRSGAVALQLSPAFLDEMTQCRPEDAPPADVILRAGDGSIDAKGDCVFASVGVSCHYHSGSEFVAAGTAQQTPGQGELHCIFPSSDPKSPYVFGGHVVCREPGQGLPHGRPATPEVKTGATCPGALLQELQHCASARCCDDGTLTNPIAELVRDGRNDVRPDFRICAEPLTIDCALLANLEPHDANSPALGGVGNPAFVLSPKPEGKRAGGPSR